MRSIDFVDKVKCPIFFCHGKNDKLINYHDANELYEKCKDNNKKDICLIDDMDHNDVFYYLDEISYFAKIFINKFSVIDLNNNVSLDLDQKFYYFNDNSNNK